MPKLLLANVLLVLKAHCLIHLISIIESGYDYIAKAFFEESALMPLELMHEVRLAHRRLVTLKLQGELAADGEDAPAQRSQRNARTAPEAKTKGRSL